MRCQICNYVKNIGLLISDAHFFDQCKKCGWHNDDGFDLFFDSENSCRDFYLNNNLNEYATFDFVRNNFNNLPNDVIDKINNDELIYIATFMLDINHQNDGESFSFGLIPPPLMDGWSKINLSTPNQFIRMLKLKAFI